MTRRRLFFLFVALVIFIVLLINIYDLSETLLNTNKIELAETYHVNNNGVARNYYERFYSGVWTVKFDTLSGHTNLPLYITEGDQIAVNSSLSDGQLRIFITQGPLYSSEVEVINLSGEKFESTFDLTNWNEGEIIIYIVGNDAQEGHVEIEHIGID